MRNFTKKLLSTVLALVAVCCLMAAVACTEEAAGATYTLTWQTGSDATVTATGYDALPTSVSEGTEITFTITPKTGYEVTSVKANDRTLRLASDKKYHLTVNADTTVKIATEESMTGVEVTLNPEKLSYFAGETLDATGMEVNAVYSSGRKEPVTSYSVAYANGDAFAVGDTSFTVMYRGFESAPVTLTDTVLVKIVIDPQGGAIAPSYYAMLEAREDFVTLNKADDGVITFTYSALTAPVSMPDQDEWSKGEEGEFVFSGWTTGLSVAQDNAVSKTYTVTYVAKLLELEGIHYELSEVVGENDETVLVPTLVITGTFKAAKTAYLYLYEGNDKVELVGDTVGDENTQKGDPFELKFDMRKLVEKQYQGKWMDIKFRAQVGDVIDTMEIDINKYPAEFVDLDQEINDGSYAYSFKTHTPENTDQKLLKAVYTTYFENGYTMSGATNDKGAPQLTITGNVGKKYAGNAVYVDFWIGTTIGQYALIDENGSYTVTFDLSEFPLETNGYAHIRIVQSLEDLTVIYQDGDSNLLNAACLNENLDVYNIGLIENQGALRISNETGTAVYYVGKGKWGGIVVWGRNEALLTTGVTLETIGAKAYLVIYGTYGLTDEVALTELKTGLYADIQNNADTASGSTSTNSDWGSATVLSLEEPATIIVEVKDGAWKIYLDLTARENMDGEQLFSHFGSASSNLVSDNVDTTATATDGTFEYTLGTFTGWGSKLVAIYVKAIVE
ncbi:MAG: bacterial Ig-like domain-containing protein [Clostridia bacterium]|nr:bacterial Ig-like domain-containing protein [Clostridia bacterium]